MTELAPKMPEYQDNLEAKLRGRGGDTSEAAVRKVKVFSMSFDALSYNFERARKTGKASTGFETSDFGYRLSSDLLPGFDMGVRYSLFEGDVSSDTARFKPFRVATNMSLSIGRERNPFALNVTILSLSSLLKLPLSFRHRAKARMIAADSRKARSRPPSTSSARRRRTRRSRTRTRPSPRSPSRTISACTASSPA